MPREYGKGSNFHGKPGRSGGRPGNQNATRHGMKGGKLPDGCRYIEHRVNDLRRQMEAAVIKAKGRISITDAAAINSILKWERHGLLAAHWLRNDISKLSASDRLRFSEAIAKASDKRDANIKLLGLDRDKADDLFDALYSRGRKLIESNGTDTTQDDTNGDPSDGEDQAQSSEE